MVLVKERNFIIARNGEEILGRWNISTGDFYGKSGVIVRSKPRCFTEASIRGAECVNSAIKGCMYLFLDYFHFSHEKYNADYARGLEEFISVGIVPESSKYLLKHKRLSKDLVEYLIKCNNGIYDRFAVDNFNSEKKYAHYLKDKSEWYQLAFRRLIQNEPQLPVEYVAVALARCESEHAQSFLDLMGVGGYLGRIIERYHTYCMTMWGECKVERNFLTNASCVFFAYDEWRKQNMAKIITSYNDLPALYFTFGEYTARPLLTPEAFHDEAEQQGNCVERMYMERVANRQTHVVQIRKTDNLEKSVITCEVSDHGAIRQYLKRFNAWCLKGNDDDLLAFKEAYQKHLKANWRKEGEQSPFSEIWMLDIQ